MRSYLAVARTERVGVLMLAALVSRLPIGINSLAMVLYLKAERGSFGIAGAVAGGFALGIALGAPLIGRIVDRRGTGVLLPFATVHAAGVLTLLVLGPTAAPGFVLVVLAVLSGVAQPAPGSVLRARFPHLLRDRPDLVPAAFALDSVLLELTFVTAPLIVALLVAVLEPAAALVFSAVAMVVGTAVFVGILRGVDGEREEHEGERHLLGPLRSPGIRALVLTMLPFGFAIGAAEVAMPAFAAEEGHPGAAGILLATWSIGSAAGGFVYGLRPRRRSVADLHLRFALLLPLGFLPPLLAPSVGVMALLVIPAGLFIAPLIATRNELAGAIAPPGTATEALTWPLTTLVGGIALGNGVGGALADGEGWRAVIVVGAVGAAIGAATAVSRRRTLQTATA